MTQEAGSVYEFPCDYPIKVFGMAGEKFEKGVLAIIKKHVKKLDPKQIKKKLSSGEKYLSMTITIFAESQKIVESIYKDLKKNKSVLMVL